MRIAVLTQPLKTNYGGILQAYALQTILQRMGHNVVVINRDYNQHLTFLKFITRCASIIKTIILKTIFNRKDLVIKSPFSPFYTAAWSGHDILPFVRNRINLSSRITTSKLLQKHLIGSGYDCYIVGSDQVWRPCYSPCITDYFLKEVSCSSSALKIAYAASFGTDQWEFSDEETAECSKLAQLFDFISVREKSGVRLCQKFLGVDAQHVLDPTMLLSAQDYIRLIEDAHVPETTSNLFCYILDTNPESEKIVKSLERDGYETTYATLTANPTKGNPRPCQMSVEEWLRSIYDADLVVTDSFHACVFSIIFNTPFIALGNPLRGNTRFDSLLETYGLQGRLVLSYESFVEKQAMLKMSSDFPKVDSVLQELRQKSLNFLTDLVNKEN